MPNGTPTAMAQPRPPPIRSRLGIVIRVASPLVSMSHNRSSVGTGAKSAKLLVDGLEATTQPPIHQSTSKMAMPISPLPAVRAAEPSRLATAPCSGAAVETCFMSMATLMVTAPALPCG